MGKSGEWWGGGAWWDDSVDESVCFANLRTWIWILSNHIKSQAWLAPKYCGVETAGHGHSLSSQPSPEVGFWFWDIVLRHVRQRAKGEDILCPPLAFSWTCTGTHSHLHTHIKYCHPSQHTQNSPLIEFSGLGFSPHLTSV